MIDDVASHMLRPPVTETLMSEVRGAARGALLGADVVIDAYTLTSSVPGR